MSNNEDADVDLANKTVLVAQIKRKGRLQAISDYIGFIVRVVFGLTSLVVGTLEAIDSTILPFNPSRPEAYIALGLSLLVFGERITSNFEKITKALKS